MAKSPYERCALLAETWRCEPSPNAGDRERWCAERQNHVACGIARMIRALVRDLTASERISATRATCVPCWDPSNYDEYGCGFPSCGCKPPQTHTPHEEMSAEGKEALRAIVQATKTMSAEPAGLIGEAAVKRLKAAGFDIVRRKPRTVSRWTCPHCGAVHAPALGQRADVFLDWGLVWHRGCVTGYQMVPSKRGDRLPMREDQLEIPERDPAS